MICYPYRRTIRKGEKSRMWRGRIRLSPQDEMEDIPLFTTDKQTAWASVRKRALEMQQEKAGTIPPRLERESAQRKWPPPSVWRLSVRRAVRPEERDRAHVRARGIAAQRGDVGGEDLEQGLELGQLGERSIGLASRLDELS